MALFDQTIEIVVEDVARVVSTCWGLKLGKLIKASQNHTFEATSTSESGTETKVVVRVTPDPKGQCYERIQKEIVFVSYVVESGKVHHISAPIKSNNGSFIERDGVLIVVVSEWAQGAPIDFLAYSWMLDQDMVFAWGKWLAEFHAVSRQFSADFPAIATSVQRWDEMHCSILKGSILHPDDEAVMHDAQHYGVLHGDLNISNFFYQKVNNIPTLSVFDWDQTQQGWYLWDVAQSELTVYMLAEAGSIVDGSPVVQANPAQFEEWMVAGYESVAGAGSVDRARLARMVNLRKHFYEKFCRTVKEQDALPKDMEHFVNYVIGWFDKHPLKPVNA